MRGRTYGATPMRVQDRGASPEPQIEVNEDYALPEPTTAPLLQDTLLRMMGMLKKIT